MNQVLIRLTLALFSAPLAAFSHMPGSHTHTHTFLDSWDTLPHFSDLLRSL